MGDPRMDLSLVGDFTGPALSEGTCGGVRTRGRWTSERKWDGFTRTRTLQEDGGSSYESMVKTFCPCGSGCPDNIDVLSGTSDG